MKNPFHKPIDLYLKLDGLIIRRLNDAYLWALDWSGIYVGTIIFFGSVPSLYRMVSHGDMWFAAFFLFCTILIALPRYVIQGMGMIEVFNNISMQFESSAARHFLNGFNIVSLFSDAFHRHNPLDVFCDIMILFMWYTFTFKIRKRDPKTFELKVPKLAHVTHT
jgi:hypothetical protein